MSMTTPNQLAVMPARRAPRTFRYEMAQIRMSATIHESTQAGTSTPPITAPVRSAGMKKPR